MNIEGNVTNILFRVTERAVIARIKRKVAHEGWGLSYGTNPWCSGEKVWRIYNLSTNTVHDTIDDLEDYARDLGVLGKNEKMVTS